MTVARATTWTKLARGLGLLGLAAGLTAAAAEAIAPGGLAEAGWLGWASAGGLVLLAAWLGWVIRQAWSHPRRLQEAEQRWTAGAPLESVEKALARAPLATGEVGYRLGILKGHVRMAAWDRQGAWIAYREAHLCRLPFWWRPPVRRFLLGDPSLDRIATGRRLLRAAPRMPHLHLAQARNLLCDPTHAREARPHLRLAMLHGAEDPLLLDMLLREAIAAPRPPTGGQDPSRPLLKRARTILGLLLDRHGDPRLSWGRGLPAWRLVLEGDLEMALRVTRSLPFEYRLDPLAWRAEIEALRRMGDEQEAWHLAADALRFLPESLHLWTTFLDLALVLRRDGDAKTAVGRAEELWKRQGITWDPDLHAEWQLLRAEHLFSLEGDAAGALALLEQLPARVREGAADNLDIEVDLALARNTEAYAKVQSRLQGLPGDHGLLVLKGECLAGMGEWASLRQFLADLDPDLQNQAACRHLSGLAKANLGDPSGAKQDLELASALDPGELRYILDAGHACMELGEWDRAEQHWRQALKLDDRNAEALYQLAEVRDALHDGEGARRYLRECLTHHPDDIDAQAFLSDLESN